jgi:hypothetical protein
MILDIVIKKWGVTVRLIRWGIIIGMFLLGFYFKSEIITIVMHEDTMDQSFINSMIRCRLFPQKTMILRNQRGREYTVPLPAGTIYDHNGIYLTYTTNFDQYFKDVLPEFGWSKVEARGNTFDVKDKTGTKWFQITIVPYKGMYRTLKYRGE